MAVREGYGLTEASPIVTTTAVDDVLRPGSIGPPLPGVDVRLVDADGDDVLAGDPGEIWVRGPNVFPGYWHDDETTARVLTADGWLRTGDVAVADDDGCLTLVDRAKDLVIVSGFNVYPAEVESVIAEHPDVAEVAVVGVDDPRTGEALVAFVVSSSGRSITDSTLRVVRRCSPGPLQGPGLVPDRRVAAPELPRQAHASGPRPARLTVSPTPMAGMVLAAGARAVDTLTRKPA